MTKIIEVIVSPTGETKVETKGFAGASCRDVSRFLEQALGVAASEQLTAEFHATSTDATLQQNQGAQGNAP